MQVPFGDLKREYEELKNELDDAVYKVMASGNFILGENMRKFEQSFADYCGAAYCAGCASGTEAIALALMAYGVSYGDEVITTNVTAVPTITGITMTGAQPNLVDVCKDTLLINPDLIEKNINSKTKAIVPVHLYGQPCDMDAIKKIAEKYSIPIIEDACQAHGSEYKGKKTGTLGNAACFSFYPSKNLGCYGDGGAVTTDSKEIYDKILMLRNYGQSKRYYHDSQGINSRLDEIQAAILNVKLSYLDKWNIRRQTISKMYKELIKNSDIEFITEKNYNVSNYHLFVIKTLDRDESIEKLQKKGILTLIHYPVNIHLQKAFSYLNYPKDSFPESRNAAEKIISLPMFPQLTDTEVEYVCQCLK